MRYYNINIYYINTWILGQSVLDGDSGAGLTFVHDDLYFLTGIVSLKERHSKNDSVTVLTDVGQNIPWIHKIYTNITNGTSEFKYFDDFSQVIL